MRVYVESFGCSQNLGESAEIERALHDAGHAICDGPAGADLGVLVSWAVIGPTESRMVRRWAWLTERVPRVIVTGCLVPMRTDLLKGPGRARTRFVPIREQAQIPDLLDRWVGPGSLPPPTGPKETSPGTGSPVGEVTIAQGCTSACSYGYSRLARGPLASTPAEEVVQRVELARDRGAVEVRHSSLDTSCWGEEGPGPERLPDLLERVAAVPGEFTVRLGMMSPPSLSPIAERLGKVLARERFFQFLHLPVQSGSDSVLDAMHRGYHVAEFTSQVEGARHALGDPTPSTDVIGGFPTETDPDVRATLDLIESDAPDIVNVTRFSPRPSTPAARLTPHPGRIVKERSRALARLRTEVAPHRMERWIGRTVPVRIVEDGTIGTSIGRLSNYLPVILPRSLPLGSRTRVQIDGARSNYLMGRAMDM